MLTQDVITHFHTRTEVAKKLGITVQAVSQWGDKVPPLRAAQLHRITSGKLRFDPADYPRYWQGSAAIAVPEAAA